MKYALTNEDRAKGVQVRKDRSDSWNKRRAAELTLLNKLYAEMAMPEWYPHQ